MHQTILLVLATCLALSPVAVAAPEQQQTDLPEGHPVLTTPSSSSDAIPEVSEGAGTGATSLVWTDPPEWVSEPPANNMRRAQYQVPGQAGDGECVVYYFGPGQGGTPERNVERWADQFITTDGGSARDALITESIEVNGVPVLLSEIAGTYTAGSMMGGSGTPLAGYMLLGAVASGPDANWFFKFTGPESTVEENREAFRAMIESIEAGD